MHRKCIFLVAGGVGAHCEYQVLIQYDYWVHTWCHLVPFLMFVFRGNLSLADTVSLIKSAEGQIIGLTSTNGMGIISPESGLFIMILIPIHSPMLPKQNVDHYRIL